MIVGFRLLSKPVFSRVAVGGAQLHSTVLNLPIPLPTTVAGALGALLGIQLKVSTVAENLCSELKKLEDLKELYSELKKRTGCRDPCIKGPLTYFDGKPYLNVGDLFVPAVPDVLDSVGRLHSIPEDKKSEYIKHVLFRKVGIALERRAATMPKVVKPGFFYTVGTSLYVREADKTLIQPIFKYTLGGLLEKCGEIVRFGGESALAEVLCEDEVADVVENIKSPLERLSEGIYIALAPVPIIPISCEHVKRQGAESMSVLNVDEAAGVCFETPFKLSEVIGLPGSSRGGIVVKLPKVRVERLGLGYSESLKMRRPQILAFPQGTIVQIKETAPRGFSDLMKTLLGIGFASLYKLPL